MVKTMKRGMDHMMGRNLVQKVHVIIIEDTMAPMIFMTSLLLSMAAWTTAMTSMKDIFFIIIIILYLS